MKTNLFLLAFLSSIFLNIYYIFTSKNDKKTSSIQNKCNHYCCDTTLSEAEVSFYEPFCSNDGRWQSFLSSSLCSTTKINGKKEVDIIRLSNITTQIIPQSYQKFKHTRAIIIKNTKITKLPTSETFRKLSFLWVERSLLADVTTFNHDGITSITLINNPLREMRIDCIAALQEVTINQCKLQKITFSKGYLDKLEILDISDNALTDETVSNLTTFDNMPNLKKVILKKNPIKDTFLLTKKYPKIIFKF